MHSSSPPRRFVALWTLVIQLGWWSVAISQEAQKEVVDDTFFELKIRPLLWARCVECHNDENRESGLSLTSRDAMLRGGKLGPSLVPGKPKESLLISALQHDAFLKMPPKDKLATSQLALFTQWVANGAPWPTTEPSSNVAPTDSIAGGDAKVSTFTEKQRNFWAYQPIRDVAVPAEPLSSWWNTSIDAFVEQTWREKGISVPSPASKHELIRRVTLDLIGLPPTWEEVDEFLHDESPDAYWRVVDRLLASPRYGEKWGRHWLDVARYADSNGLDENIAYANAYRYRDYVIQSWNRDKPYDRFVQEQIAGDLLPEDPTNADHNWERLVATGFLSIGAKMLAEDDPVKMQMDIIDEQMSTLCQAFMGLTMGCARCHDHKFDPFTAEDYYGMAGIFKSSKTMENHKVVARWFERPVATQRDVERVQEIEQHIRDENSKLDEIRKEYHKQLDHELRSDGWKVLNALWHQKSIDDAWLKEPRSGLPKSDAPYRIENGYGLLEAEHFHRGNAIPDHQQYGTGIGVIISRGASKVEYDLDVDREGIYGIEIRFAAADKRPILLGLADREPQFSILDEATGSWLPEHQRWVLACYLPLQRGRNTLVLSSEQVIPHLDKIAIASIEPGARIDESIDSNRSLIVHAQSLGISPEYVALVRELGLQATEAKTKPETWGSIAHWLMQWQRSTLAERQKIAETIRKESESWNEPGPLQLFRKTLAERAAQLGFDDVAMQDKLVSNLLLEQTPVGDGNHGTTKQSMVQGIAKITLGRWYRESQWKQAASHYEAIRKLQREKPNFPMAMGVTEDKAEELKVHLRGSHLVLGKVVPRKVPTILTRWHSAPEMPKNASGRLEFAQWMTDDQHPLTSRVMANRLWHWHFGKGLVPTVDNFGLLGLPPSHPELLDHLANTLKDHDWSLKWMHQTILQSYAYQMSSRHSEVYANLDPENQWLWKFRKRRLTAEETRDSIMSVCEGLDHKMFGSLMKVENHKYVNSTGTAGTLDYNNLRRSIYLPVIRSGVFDVLQTLDFPDPAMSSGERQTSTVAPQALLLMNSDLVQEQTQKIAAQAMQAEQNLEARIEWVYRRILQRLPMEKERMAIRQFLGDLPEKSESSADTSNEALVQRWQSLCRVLISSNEFHYVE
ncbi:MAG: DUF1549 domain-containing protein [Pirellulales bacterium]